MDSCEQLKSVFGDLDPWRAAPSFWPAHPDQGVPFIGTLKEAAVKTIGRSIGGHEILAIEYGAKEPANATTDASLNLCNIIETGTDLLGRPWPELRDMARAARVCIIPWLNMDGAVRSPVAHHAGMPASVAAALVGGVMKDGTALNYPAFKAVFPICPQ